MCVECLAAVATGMAKDRALLRGKGCIFSIRAGRSFHMEPIDASELGDFWLLGPVQQG